MSDESLFITFNEIFKMSAKIIGKLIQLLRQEHNTYMSLLVDREHLRKARKILMKIRTKPYTSKIGENIVSWEPLNDDEAAFLTAFLLKLGHEYPDDFVLEPLKGGMWSCKVDYGKVREDLVQNFLKCYDRGNKVFSYTLMFLRHIPSKILYTVNTEKLAKWLAKLAYDFYDEMGRVVEECMSSQKESEVRVSFIQAKIKLKDDDSGITINIEGRSGDGDLIKVVTISRDFPSRD